MGRNANRSYLVLVALCTAVVQVGCQSRPAVGSVGAAQRVGTYNSQAVALAFGRSQMHENMIDRAADRYRKARATGDEVEAKRIKSDMAKRQRRMHEQVFGGAAIDDIMTIIADDLPDIMRAKNVDVIVSESGYKGPADAAVDVTADMAELFAPTAETRKFMEQIRREGPVRGAAKACK